MLSDVRGSSRRRSCHLTGSNISNRITKKQKHSGFYLEMLAHFYQWEALSTPFQCSTCISKKSIVIF